MKKSVFGKMVGGMLVVFLVAMMSWNVMGQEVTKNYRVDFKSVHTEMVNITRDTFRIDVTIESSVDLMNVINQSSDFSISLGQWGTEQIISNASTVRITNKMGYAKCLFDGGTIVVKWNSSKIILTVIYNSTVFGDNIVNLINETGYVSGTIPLTIEVVTPGQDASISIKANAMYSGYTKMVGQWNMQRWNIMGNFVPFKP